MSKFVTYHTNNGCVKSIYEGSLTFSEFIGRGTLQEGRSVIEVHASLLNDPLKIYVDINSNPPVVKEREVFNLTTSKTTFLANGVDEVTISSIPNGTLVTWPDGQVDEVTDGVVELSATQPKTYVLKFEHVHHLPMEVSLEAYI